MSNSNYSLIVMDYLAWAIFKSVEAAISHSEKKKRKRNGDEWLLLGGSKTSPERSRSDTDEKECYRRVSKSRRKRKTVKSSFKLPADIVSDKLRYRCHVTCNFDSNVTACAHKGVHSGNSWKKLVLWVRLLQPQNKGRREQVAFQCHTSLVQ